MDVLITSFPLLKHNMSPEYFALTGNFSSGGFIFPTSPYPKHLTTGNSVSEPQERFLTDNHYHFQIIHFSFPRFFGILALRFYHQVPFLLLPSAGHPISASDFQNTLESDSLSSFLHLLMFLFLAISTAASIQHTGLSST